MEKLLFNWKNVRVSVYFKESRAVYEALLVHQVTPSLSSALSSRYLAPI